MKCIAIDDEPIALAILSQYCERRGGIELETYSNPRLGMQRIKESRPELVFMDIEMGSTSGVALARELPKECGLIFTTAYAHYAIDGFEVNAIDFLHKPFFYDRFGRAMQKAEERLRMNRMLSLSQNPERQITLKVQYKNMAVSTDDILYIEAMDNYIKVYRINKPVIVSQINLKNLMPLLPEREFIRIHRSYVAAVNKIAKFTKQQIVLTDSTTLPIGRMYAEEVYDQLQKKGGRLGSVTE